MYQEIEAYLPHRSPMVLLEKVLAIRDNTIECGVTVDDTGVLANFLTLERTLPSWFLIEIMAQTIGVWNGNCEVARNQTPRLGFLLGIRSFESKIAAVPYGSCLISRGEKILQDDTIANFNCAVYLNNEEIATGKLTVYGPSDEEINTIFS